MGEQPVTFLVDTGAQHSVLTQTSGPLSEQSAWVQGATGGKRYRWTTDRKVQLATGKVTHSFLHVPDCPYPLLGRDLLTKLRDQIHFEDTGAKITGPDGGTLQILTLWLEDEYRLYQPPGQQTIDMAPWLNDFPLAWAETGGLGMALHPTVPNPYNLLSTLPPSHVWYTVLDLKDAFFCLRLHPESQSLFAFEWKDPDLGLSGQLTWTQLPQGFKNSPTLFDEALHRDLGPGRLLGSVPCPDIAPIRR